MNMVGNMGAAVSAVAFPWFVASVTIPFFAESTGTASSFFVFAAVMNTLAVAAWLFMNPKRELRKLDAAELTKRIVFFAGMIVIVVSALVYTKFLLPKDDNSSQSSATQQTVGSEKESDE